MKKGGTMKKLVLVLLFFSVLLAGATTYFTTTAIEKNSPGEFISKEMKAKLQKDYRGWTKYGHIDSEIFGVDKVREVLDQEGIAYLSVGFGKKDGRITSILYGIDTNGNDMDTKILELAMPCPPYCRDKVAEK
jgi:hypothetical protein